MAGETIVNTVGTLVADPELRYTSSGAAVASFRIASTPRTFDKTTNAWTDGEPLFLSCSVWRQYAENVVESLSKGMQVIVSGRLKQRSYEKDGQTRTVIELDVDDVGPTLRFATATVTKSQRGGSSGGGQSGGDWGSNGQQGAVQRSGGQGQRGGQQDDPWGTSGGRGGYDETPPF